MSIEVKKRIQVEIAHVLFIDVVGYSKLLIDDQREILGQMNEVIRETPHFREAEAAGQLIALPSGDGMALVFLSHPEAPLECALEISKALQAHPHIRVRMGVHSGPVSGVTDVNDRSIVAGAGINMAQRVMDCGDAGHILLSKRVATDLVETRQWEPYLHDLGECEVKHGVVISLVNFYTAELGNPEIPAKLRTTTTNSGATAVTTPRAGAGRKRALVGTIALLVIALAISVGFWIASHRTAPAPHSEIIAEKSIAVLPFENLSEEKANAYFAEGIQDEILTRLAHIADLKVISRTSVMQYKSGIARNLREIGQQLGVARVVEGSVQRAGNKVRINAQLIDARRDAHLWAQTYDRDLVDVFAIQSEIAKAIADQLQAKLSPQEKAAIEQPPTTDVTAFDLYSRAKSLIFLVSFSAIARPSLLQAVDLLNQAIVRDPSFFLAQCQLANTHDYLYFLGYDHTAERLALGDAAIQAAFRLRPDAGEAHLARAENLYRGHLDYNGALTELEIARRTLPNDPRVFELTGYIARRQGKQEEALRSLERALELDPRNWFTLQQIALSYSALRRYSEEAAILDRVLAIKQDDPETKVVRALVELDWKADTRPLHETIDSIREKNPAAIQSVADNWFLCALAERDAAGAASALAALAENVFGNDAVRFHRDFGESLLARMMKDKGKARAAFAAARAQQEKVVQAQPNYGPALCILGLIDAGLGRKDEALREGRRAIELLPVQKDSLNGAHMIAYFAITAAWTGEKDLACEQLAIATRLSGLGTTSYGQLKLLPYWDTLRGDPRFEKIVASLAPKESISK